MRSDLGYIKNILLAVLLLLLLLSDSFRFMFVGRRIIRPCVASDSESIVKKETLPLNLS
jgi:hypothetical protein